MEKCPRCSSLNTKRNGTVRGKTRSSCKDCGRSFSVSGDSTTDTALPSTTALHSTTVAALHSTTAVVPPESLPAPESFDNVCASRGVPVQATARLQKLLLDGYGAEFVARQFRMLRPGDPELLCRLLGIGVDAVVHPLETVVQARHDAVLDALGPIDPRVVTALREFNSVREGVMSALRFFFVGPDEDLTIDTPEPVMVAKSYQAQKQSGMPLSRWALAYEALGAEVSIPDTSRLTGLTFAEVAIFKRRMGKLALQNGVAAQGGA